MPPRKQAPPVITISLEDQFLACQTFGHAWDNITGTAAVPVHAGAILTGKRMVLRCIRCTTTREDVLNGYTGDLIHRAYDYPQGYKIVRDKGVAAPKRTDYRLQYISRFADLFEL